MQEHTATYIADLIRQGFTGGVGPRWTISFDFDHYAPEGEQRVETIADLVERGHSFGPGWRLTLDERHAADDR